MGLTVVFMLESSTNQATMESYCISPDLNEQELAELHSNLTNTAADDTSDYEDFGILIEESGSEEEKYNAAGAQSSETTSIENSQFDFSRATVIAKKIIPMGDVQNSEIANADEKIIDTIIIDDDDDDDVVPGNENNDIAKESDGDQKLAKDPDDEHTIAIDSDGDHRIAIDSDSDHEDDNENDIESLLDPDDCETKPKIKPLENDILSNSYDTLIEFSCPKCGVTCGSYKNWKAHIDIVHNFCKIESLNMQTIVGRKGDIQNKCRTCGIIFHPKANYSTLLLHRMEHLPHPKFAKCRLCGKSFSRRNYYRMHLKYAHNEEYRKKIELRLRTSDNVRFNCPLCNSEMKDRKAWSAHLESEHAWSDMISQAFEEKEDNVFECNICKSQMGASYKQCHALKHAKYNSFNCKICDDFSTKALIACSAHIRKEHLGTCYLCMYCNQSFRSGAARKKHIFVNHTVGEQCGVCQKSFGNTAYLLHHMRIANHQKFK